MVKYGLGPMEMASGYLSKRKNSFNIQHLKDLETIEFGGSERVQTEQSGLQHVVDLLDWKMETFVHSQRLTDYPKIE